MPVRRVWRSLFFSLLVLQSLPAQGAAGFSPERLGFAVVFKGEIASYRVNSVSALPGEPIRLEVFARDGKASYVVKTPLGKATRVGTRQWRWRAPRQTGLYPVTIGPAGSSASMTLNVFVMVPYQSGKRGHVDGYRIGRYPGTALRGLSIYRAPRGFIQVTPQNRDTLVSPHFRLGQFLCKQEGGYPKYVVLRGRLLQKLELILERVHAQGYAAKTLRVMSGYRTPHYNRAIGNGRYSRHLWGGAADVFIDESPADGMMDDLNRDGAIDERDAAVLYEIVDRMDGQPFSKVLVGGLASYEKTAFHGPFVHVDARGFRARW